MLYNDAAFDAFFKRAVAAVAPYADSLVCIGGCANALYRHHELAKRPWPAYLGTKDVDWAIPQILPISANAASISERMIQAGFIEDTLGTSATPVIKYLPADRGMAAVIEFLCPLSGVKGARGSGSLVSTQVQPGLYAQPLRYLELLLHKPWRVSMRSIAGFEEIADHQILVPNPSAYVVQKVLIRSQRRDPESLAKDCYYIYEVSVIFRRSLGRLHEEYQAMQTHSVTQAKWLRTFRSSAEKLFHAETSEGPTSACRVHAALAGDPDTEKRITPAMVNESVQKLLDALG